jgi:hypothetical protein
MSSEFRKAEIEEYQMSRNLLTLTLGTVFALGLAGPMASQTGDRRASIEWPGERREFPTLQSAIDALADGGKLTIQKGRFELSEPLIVRNKRITIEGAGCGDELPRTRAQANRATHLAGPRPLRVAPFSEVAGLVTYLGTGGGVLRGLKLSGFDAAVRVTGGDDTRVAPSALTVEDTCIAHTGRGIASSASAAKLVVQNVLIRDVLWNGIAVSPIAFTPGFTPESILTSFGVTLLNTGQACVVVKNSLYTAFQNHLDACGYNGGAPGQGGGVMAVNAGVNFIESTINVTNGPGIAAKGGTTFVQHTSVIRSSIGAGILLFQPLYAMVKDSHVILTDPYPPGHVQAGFYGDGVTVAGPGIVWVGNSRMWMNAHSGLANLGATMDIGDTTLRCNAFDLEGEAFPTPADDFQLHDRGGNRCGCPVAVADSCVAESSVMAPLPPQQINPVE